MNALKPQSIDENCVVDGVDESLEQDVNQNKFEDCDDGRMKGKGAILS